LQFGHPILNCVCGREVFAEESGGGAWNVIRQSEKV